MFNNIDGNATNFDTFVADISQYNVKFSVIAIAETNINEESKVLYNIPGYESEYSSKIPNKSKGTGLGIYICNDFQFNRLEKFCCYTENLEALFVEVTNLEIPQTIGVIYRPPSGNLLEFYNELECLLTELPNKNVQICGDFNIDLLSKNNNEFEHLIFEKNLIPTISLATHEKPGCAPSLIDNILINSTQNLNLSGILESKVSHHHPIFNIFTVNLNETDNPTKCPRYDFCESNTNKFLGEIEGEMSKMIPVINFNEQGFEKFVEIFHAKIDDNFLVDESKFKQSKRNRLSNPWITNGIIASVQCKSYFYEKSKNHVLKKISVEMNLSYTLQKV